MKSRINATVISFFALTSCCYFSSAQSQGSAATESASQSRLDSIVRERVEVSKKSVGMVAFNADENGLIISTHGAQGIGKGAAAISADTLFEVGSVTKTFTALLLADMVLKGEVALTDPAEKFLPDGVRLRDKAGAQITLTDLATHRSGSPRLPDGYTPPDPADPYAAYTERDLLGYLRARSADGRGSAASAARNEAYAYSNLGYTVLGYVLSRAGGKPFRELMQSRVLTPLALRSTYFVVPESETARFSDGHDAEGKTVAHWNFGIADAAGALRMSVRDFARYGQAASGLIATPLAPAFKLAMQFHAVTDDKNNIGLAWHPARIQSATRAVWTHDGATYGFSSSLWVDPESKKASGAIGNAFAPVTDIARHLLDPLQPLLNFTQTQAVAQAVAATTVAQYAGIYTLAPGVDLTIRAQGSELFAQATGQSEFEIFAKSETQFFARVTPLEIYFFEIESGKAQRLEVLQGGRTTVARRTGATLEIAMPKAEVIEQYLGTYRLAPNFDVTVRGRSGKLFAQATGQGEIELFAKSETVFFARVASLEIEFLDVKASKTMRFILTQGGVKQNAVRVE